MTERQTRKKTMTTDLAATAVTATSRRTAKSPTKGSVKGHVSFVGTGPGDASLLTVRAADLLRQADVVVTELPEQSLILDAVPRDAGAPPFEIVDGSVGEDGEQLTHAARARLVSAGAGHSGRVQPPPLPDLLPPGVHSAPRRGGAACGSS